MTLDQLRNLPNGTMVKFRTDGCLGYIRDCELIKGEPETSYRQISWSDGKVVVITNSLTDEWCEDIELA